MTRYDGPAMLHLTDAELDAIHAALLHVNHGPVLDIRDRIGLYLRLRAESRRADGTDRRTERGSA